MTVAALAETADFYRIDASPKLDARKRTLLGQYMTPTPIGRFMASLYSQTRGEMRVLDPRARVGSLTAALAERVYAAVIRPRSVEFVCNAREDQQTFSCAGTELPDLMEI